MNKKQRYKVNEDELKEKITQNVNNTEKKEKSKDKNKKNQKKKNNKKEKINDEPYKN